VIVAASAIRNSISGNSKWILTIWISAKCILVFDPPGDFEHGLVTPEIVPATGRGRQRRAAMKDAASKVETDRPMDRPMTGILTQDDNRRTEHNLHPLDPSYNGTTIQETKGSKEAAAAREEAGLVDPA
jgi:hypothetical protein